MHCHSIVVWQLFLCNLYVGQPTENNVAWQRFLPTGPIAMLPVINQRYLRHCFCPHRAAICHINIWYLVRHSCPTRRALWFGRLATGSPRSCWSWTRRASLTLSTLPSWVLPQTSNICSCIYRELSTCVTQILFLLLCPRTVSGRASPKAPLMCRAVFSNSCKTIVSLFSPNLYSTNIPLSFLLCLRNSFFPMLAIYTVPANGRGHHGWVTLGSRPGLLIKPVVSHCRPLLHGMFFKQS